MSRLFVVGTKYFESHDMAHAQALRAQIALCNAAIERSTDVPMLASMHAALMPLMLGQPVSDSELCGLLATAYGVELVAPTIIDVIPEKDAQDDAPSDAIDIQRKRAVAP